MGGWLERGDLVLILSRMKVRVMAAHILQDGTGRQEEVFRPTVSNVYTIPGQCISPGSIAKSPGEVCLAQV